MKLTKTLISTLLIASFTGCGFADTDSPAAASPSTDVATNNAADEAPADDEPTDEEPVANNSVPEVPEEPIDEPVEPGVEDGRFFYEEESTSRCAQGSERCSTAANALAPTVAAKLDFMNIANPVTDCDEVEEYALTGDGIACAFDRLGNAVSNRIDAEHFSNSFVYELYQESGEWRLDVYKTDAAGKVVPSSLAQNSAKSLYGFDDVTVDGDTVTAQAGEILIRTDYWGFPIEMGIRNAKFEGTTSMQGNTRILQSGELSGHFEVLDLFAALNQQASACAGDVAEPFTSDSSEFASCPDFRNHADPVCQGFDFWCPMFSPFAIMADVDLNDDGLADAFSVRMDVEFQPGERRF